MEAQELEKQIKEKVQKKAVDGTLKCPVALEIARELEVSPQKVGKVLNRLNIKVQACQLGCF